MSNDKAMREAFETWATDQKYNIRTFEGDYYVSSTCAAWAAWQAALASSKEQQTDDTFGPGQTPEDLAREHVAALASSAAAPEQAGEQPMLTTCNCRWSGDTQVQQCTLHEAHVHAIHEWAERAKTAETATQAQPAPAAEAP